MKHFHPQESPTCQYPKILFAQLRSEMPAATMLPIDDSKSLSLLCGAGVKFAARLLDSLKVLSGPLPDATESLR